MEPQQTTPSLDRKSKQFPYVIALLLFVLLLSIGSNMWLWLQHQQLQQEMVLMTNEPTPEVTIIPLPPQEIYRNSTYAFQVPLPKPQVFGQKSTAYKAREEFEGETLRIHVDRVTTNHKPGYESFPEIDNSEQLFEIYPVPNDYKNLQQWWQNTMKEEVGNYRIPTDYEINTNNPPWDGCYTNEQSTAANEYIVVEPKEGVALSGPSISAVYAYVDFGKPFILRFVEESTGACNPNDPNLLYKLSPLNP